MVGKCMAKEVAQHVGHLDAAKEGRTPDAAAPCGGDVDREPGGREILRAGKRAEYIELVAVRPKCVVYRHSCGSGSISGEARVRTQAKLR